MKALSTLFILFLSITIATAQFNTTTTLKIGDTIPNVELSTMENNPLQLRADFKNQPLVLVFYRANWCPFCNEHLSDLQSYFKPLTKAGFKLIAISTESVENLKTTKENNFLKYMLTSDATRAAITKFGITNGSVAVPSVFITDQNHVIRYLYTNTDYKTRLSGEEVYNQALKVNIK